VGTSTGLYSTTMLNGTSTVWVQEAATTIGNVVTDMIDVRESDGLVVAGTHGKGVYSTTISTAVEEPVSQLPADFALEQNYPNPFNPVTFIRFALPSPQHVVLKIYDARGREVAKLVNERRDAGRHEVQFDAGSLPSGVYICRIQAGSFSDSKKMNFVK
jgi:hypothetical protein